MDARIPVIADGLLALEQQLRQLGWWSEAPPAPERLASTAPFCVDTLLFEEWLQWVFIVRMRSLLERGGPLPSSSAMQAMGEQAWAPRGAPVAGLLAALERLDHLIVGGAGH
ncbi:YqcC family protein [Pseudomonas sp. NW5]|uniref:YqcC family protein n=1 Tax=Pseudomonas sp. NW5 TaxID=2934934 RepID=UPI002020AF00|nr:YqcC family protein [Pseudomonas sp. NW5]MCL7461995.1 YqcC family protein [Pseudomonas sp. NW5]